MDESETAGYRAVTERMERELDRAGRRGLDIPAEAAFTQETLADPWYPLAMDDLTAWEGVEPANFSALDSCAVRRGRRGLRDPARLRHAARALREIRGRQPQHAGHAHPLGRARRRRRNRGGSVTARVAVVALPSAVVAEGAVVFAPHLPAEVLQAHHDLPLGILDKVALRFKKNVFPSEGTEFLQMKRDDGRGLNYLTRHWDSNVCIAFAAGPPRARARGRGRGGGDRPRGRRAHRDAGRRRRASSSTRASPPPGPPTRTRAAPIRTACPAATARAGSSRGPSATASCSRASTPSRRPTARCTGRIFPASAPPPRRAGYSGRG